jgi:tRNA(Ile)-lysidine synthase
LSAHAEDVLLHQALRTWHAQWGPGVAPSQEQPLLIAYSGGLDSSALLGTAQLVWPGGVHAVHVNHGLQEQANAFEAHCTHWCAQHGIPLTVCRGTVPYQAGDSLEEQARLFRYRQLADVACQQHAQAVLLAQHADDQAETVFLALTRGAGVAGLAGMGWSTIKHDVLFGRPWLGVRQSVLRDTVQGAGWCFIDDPSNQDVRYTRNLIRHELLPHVEHVFPGIVQALTRCAQHCAQADALLQETASADLKTVINPEGWPILARLQRLPSARLAGALRLWLKKTAGRTPSTAQLNELLKQVSAARTRGHRIDLKVVDGKVQRKSECLMFSRSL